MAFCTKYIQIIHKTHDTIPSLLLTQPSSILSIDFKTPYFVVVLLNQLFSFEMLFIQICKSPARNVREK